MGKMVLLGMVFTLLFSITTFSSNWRTPLTFKDTGLYGGGPDESFDFYIFQWDVQHLPLKWDVKKADALVAQLHSKGKKVIARLYLWKRWDEEARPIEEYYKEVDAVLENVTIDNLYGISLSEENIHWKGHGEVLEKLYDYVKKKWPDLLVFQWFSHQLPDVIDLNKADGYIINVYNYTAPKFLPYLQKYLATGKPVIAVIFAANQRGNWSWSPLHMKIFEDQWRICKEYNVPVTFYCAGPVSSKLNRLTRPWETEDIMTRLLYRAILEKVKEADGEIVEGNAWREVVRKTEEMAAKIKKPGIYIREIDNGKVEFEYYDDFSQERNYKGKFVVKATKGLLKVTHTTKGVLPDVLVWEGDSLWPRIVTRETKEAYDMQFFYHFESPYPISETIFALKQYANKILGASINYLTVSRDGKRWEVTPQAHIVFEKFYNGGKICWLSIFDSYDASTFQNLNSFWVRLRMVKKHRVSTDMANSFYKFIVRGVIDTTAKSK